MRLIDADALMERLSEKLRDGDVLYNIPPSAIDNAPTIDAVPVVRCKDCAWSKKLPYNDEGHRFCYMNDVVRADGFCYHGAREDEDGST